MRARLEHRRSPESAFPRENPQHQAGARVRVRAVRALTLISVLMFGGNHLSIRHHGYWTSMMHSLCVSFSAGHTKQKKRMREREGGKGGKEQ